MAETISRGVFTEQLAAGELAMSLVGMSNIGKSHWSGVLAEEGRFTRICCDDLIEAQLEGVLAGHGYQGIADMAKWLGQPYDPQFAANQNTYLDLETTVTRDAVSQLARGLPERNTIIDTTGSVVHTPPAIQRGLAALTTVVYLEATPDMYDEMLERYVAQPKPVVWGDVYASRDGEAPEETLARCYPTLLAHRSGLYAAMAHVIIPRQDALDLAGSENFLEYVAEALPA